MGLLIKEKIMSAYSNQLKTLIEQYQKEKNIGNGIVDPHELAAWAYGKGLYKPNVKTMVDAIATDISQAFREEYRTAPNGVRYRAKHAYTKRVGNKTISLWADMDDLNAPHDHFKRSFSQRRQQIVGDCIQLNNDVSVYNETRNNEDPIQLILDFNADIEEARFLSQNKAA